ncbi:MAG: DNA polymerase III subunit delta [Phaeovulum sp.]|uniref:DNA polymerase III subunit delta n=1 Tax=Phaeovulum sp. TaxID=2934796 RepID=UPI00272EF490|nr:DNA polymerase III subunit delta [Phaeovulum sp.]MDP2063931.1 DNA polymerase III subunit delta [Phaeovulum sp.]
MKLTGAAAARFLAHPAPDLPGVLLYGGDAMRVALKRQDLIALMIGAEGEREMRLTRIDAADLRKDPAALADALRAQGFFPGPRAVLLEAATDTATPLVQAALADWRKGDATLVVTAAVLAPRSSLRKLFEDHPGIACIGIYDDPPSSEEIAQSLAKAGLRNIGREAMADLVALAQALDPGDFRQTIEKISLYKHGDVSPLSCDDVAACTPATIEAEVDDLLHVVAEGRVADFAPMMQRIAGQAVLPVSLAIAAARHFRTLYAAKADPGGPAAGLARARPPVQGPRRDRMLRQAQAWPTARLEEALRQLVETDLSLRSSQRAPAMAVIERTLIRLARLAKG